MIILLPIISTAYAQSLLETNKENKDFSNPAFGKAHAPDASFFKEVKIYEKYQEFKERSSHIRGVIQVDSKHKYCLKKMEIGK